MTSHNAREPVEAIPEDIRRTAYIVASDIRHHIAHSEIELIKNDPDVTSIVAKAILAERDGCQWRPIKTAPKDGEWVFLFVPGHGPARARWNGRSWMSHTNARQITRGTHWMPLPASPKTEG